MADMFANKPKAGTFLEGRVRTFVSEWESSDFFVPAFGLLFAGKIAHAAAIGATELRDYETANNYMFRYVALKNLASLTARGSKALAQTAAATFVESLTGGGYLHPDPKISNNYDILLLLGHSRGAAVNARITSLLARKGYLPTQYTALDGFSTDWPDDGGLLGDLDLAKDAKAKRLTNYRVQRGVEGVVARDVDPISDPLREVLFDGLVAAIEENLILSTETRRAMLTFDIRAPIRNTFADENPTFPGDGKRSDHLNITEDFMKSHLFWDNYIGEHHEDLNPPNTKSVGLNAVGGADSVLPPSSMESPDLLLQFRDPNFSEAGELLRTVTPLMGVASGEPIVDAWIRRAGSPMEMLSFVWRTSGVAELTDTEGNPGARLSSRDVISEISQTVNLGRGERRVTGTLKAASLNASTRLDVVWRGSPIFRLVVDSASATTRFNVPLETATGVGELGFRLVGGGENQSAVVIDDLAILLPKIAVSDIQINNAGELLLKLDAEVGGDFDMEHSTDLINWSYSTSITIANGTTDYRVEGVRESHQAIFYRLRRIE